MQGQYSLQAYSYCANDQPYVDVYTRLPLSVLPSGKDIVRQLLLLRGQDTIYADLAKVDIAVSVGEQEDIYDLHRVSTSYEGAYTVVVAVLADEQVVQTMETSVRIMACSTLLLSDAMLLASATSCLGGATCKYNKVMEPLLGHTTSDSIETVYLYVEYYHRTDQAAFLTYGVRDSDSTYLMAHKRVGIDPLQVLILPMGTDVLTGGDYEAFVEVYDAEKQILSSKVTALHHIDLSAFLTTADANVDWVDTLSTEQLVFDVKSLLPIMGNADINAATAVLVDRKRRLLAGVVAKFWLEQRPDDPAGGYYGYRAVAQAVHERFYNNVGAGVETDRGYLYLKYGKPNDIIKVEDEPDAPPYQIWRYNYITATRQSNVKFIFYNPSLVANDYYLLHSTCRGELQNPQWEVELYSKAPWDQSDNRVDGTTMTDGYNRQARRLFDSL